MAGRRQEAALALIRPISALARLIREFPRSLCRLPRNSELGFGALALGDIANGRGNEQRIVVLNGT